MLLYPTFRADLIVPQGLAQHLPPFTLKADLCIGLVTLALVDTQQAQVQAT
jgi:hypothetical protein